MIGFLAHSGSVVLFSSPTACLVFTLTLRFLVGCCEQWRNLRKPCSQMLCGSQRDGVQMSGVLYVGQCVLSLIACFVQILVLVPFWGTNLALLWHLWVPVDARRGPGGTKGQKEHSFNRFWASSGRLLGTCFSPLHRHGAICLSLVGVPILQAGFL